MTKAELLDLQSRLNSLEGRFISLENKVHGVKSSVDEINDKTLQVVGAIKFGRWLIVGAIILIGGSDYAIQLLPKILLGG